MNAPGLMMRTDGAVRILVNSNPAAKNAITPALYDALPAALEGAAQDPAIGAIVLVGDGDFFCAGGDLRQLATRRALAQARLSKLFILSGLPDRSHRTDPAERRLPPSGTISTATLTPRST